VHLSRSARRTGVALAATAFLVGGVASPALADPAGDNGTVKIDGRPFDSAPDNEPHVGCKFQVDFYGFDKGDLWASVNFTGQAPTGKGVSLLDDNVFIGEDAAGGGTDVDAQRTYNLAGLVGQLGDPQAQQGYHIKLTVHADGSQGADTKYKVFWVDCDGGYPQAS
jgi:hypothetical protein